MMQKIDIVHEIQTDALTIGNEANLSRAIPYVRDGLKPSQRAVIYGAHEQNYSSKKPHVKSLKLDGQVVGAWWPHGSEYSTITRLTQDFVMNIPLLEMHGANGSQLGTNEAASSRYTEVRLSPACEDGLLKNLDKDTCDWIPNYSEDRMWPKILPALLPNLFVNGSDGMGYCYSQTWLPGNLKEFYEKVVEFLETSKTSYDNIYPDFPTRGIIVNKKDIADIYRTGTGSIILRGRVEITNNIIKITELPYQVYVTPYMEQLKGLVTPNNRGEIKITGVSDVFNMSGEDGMLIEIECEDDPNIILNKLYKYSNLQITLSANQYGIIDSIPELVNLDKYIKTYVEHNTSVIKREYTYELHKASQRLEVVEGLIRACSILDDVIREIRASENTSKAIEVLTTKFTFTKTQAQAITDMRLGKLANMEILALQKEADQLNKTITACNKILASEKTQQKEFLKRFKVFVDTYGWNRRTTVCDIDLEAEKTELTRKTRIADTCIVAIDSAGFLKRISAAQYKPNKKLELKTVEIAEDQKLIIITNRGMMYKLPVRQIPRAGINSTGTNIKTLINLTGDEKVVAIYSGTEELPYIFFVTKCGLAKKTPWAEVSGLSKNIGATVMKLNENDEIFICELIDSKQYKVIYNGREKQIFSDKFIAKSRTAGGVVAVKTKTGSFISLSLL